MPRLPRLTAKQIAVVIEGRGFFVARQSGSHVIYRNKTGARVTVPTHGSTILHPKTLKSILRDANVSVEELQTLL